MLFSPTLRVIERGCGTVAIVQRVVRDFRLRRADLQRVCDGAQVCCRVSANWGDVFLKPRASAGYYNVLTCAQSR